MSCQLSVDGTDEINKATFTVRNRALTLYCLSPFQQYMRGVIFLFIYHGSFWIIVDVSNRVRGLLGEEEPTPIPRKPYPPPPPPPFPPPRPLSRRHLASTGLQNKGFHWKCPPASKARLRCGCTFGRHESCCWRFTEFLPIGASLRWREITMCGSTRPAGEICY